MRRSILTLLATNAIALLSLTRSATAQPLAASSSVGALDACDYQTCALTIAPRLDGLGVVQGGSGARVANLHFFWPRDIAPALAPAGSRAPGADSARTYARDAMKLRRVGATFTDAGVVLAAVGAIGALSHRTIRRSDGALLGVGGSALVVSVPIQFAADAALSRAVWWHNLRYAR